MGSSILSRQEAQTLAQRVLGYSRADEVRVNIRSTAHGNTRFAVNQITTAGDRSNVTVSVTSALGRRVASATTNRLDDESLQRVVQTSEHLARLVPEDPEYLGELAPQRYRQADAFFASTAGLDAPARAAAIAPIATPAAQRNLLSTGFLPHEAAAAAVANQRGLFAYHAGTRVNFTTTVRTPDGTGSGWAGIGHHDWTHVQPAALGERAIEKAERSRQPRDVEPGRWTVVLEPTAVANLVARLMASLSAREADEGRSYFARPAGGNRIGEQLLDNRVTIHSDPADPQLIAEPFDEEGLPNQRVTWFENGILRSPVYDRYWARRNQREPTGWPAGFYMRGGDSSLEEMIRSTSRGLLVTRLWYIRSVDPRTILFTGLTRDGTFLIENGEISHSVKNLRWNESPLVLLNNLEMVSHPVRVSGTESGDLGLPMVVPALKARNFTFTSISDAV
jgi:predicted Zn-dependent protease